MQRSAIDEGFHDLDQGDDLDQDVLTQGLHDQVSSLWDCAVCGRPRLCPYATPSAGDPLHACWSCGDLLARTVSSAAAVLVGGLDARSRA